MVYWLSGCITSSMRLYYEELGKHPGPNNKGRLARDNPLASGEYCPVPTGVLCAPRELIQAPRSWAELTFNVQHWVTPPCGGHFFALEQPQLMAKEVRHFFHGVLDFGECVRTAPAPGTQRPMSQADRLFCAAVTAVAVVAINGMLRAKL